METLEASLPWVESLERIQTLADIASGLSLVFIFGPGHLARQGLKQTSEAVRGNRRVLWHRLDQHGADLSDSLATAGNRPVMLLVHGMESIERERRREIEIALNTGRNTLSPFDALVIFWHLPCVIILSRLAETVIIFVVFFEKLHGVFNIGIKSVK